MFLSVQWQWTFTWKYNMFEGKEIQIETQKLLKDKVVVYETRLS